MSYQDCVVSDFCPSLFATTWAADKLPFICIQQNGAKKSGIHRISDFLVGEGEFEPPKSLTTDLQSAPFGHSGIPPNSLVCRNGRLSGVDRKDAGAKSCVARVCGLLRLDFPFCNSNPQHLVMTDE